MINSVFATISEELNQYFGNRFSLSEEKVIISALPDSSENNNPTHDDNLIISLVNIEQEKLTSKSMANYENKPVNIYLYVLFAAGFSENNYEEALKLLSATVGFFQQKPVFTHQNTPDLHPKVEKLHFEMVNLNIQELSQMWGIQGGKYYPSVLYKARVVTIREDILSDTARMVGFGTDVNL
jgi:hypothetical protein